MLFRTTYAMERTKEEILIFGSSRANHHYHSAVLSAHLKQSVYNVGRDGHFILYNLAVLQSNLKRYTPSTILLDISRDEFAVNNADYDRLASLLPYYDDHPEIRNVVHLKGHFEKFRLLSKIYPYNSQLLTIAVGNMERNRFRDLNRDVQGYVPLHKKVDGSISIANHFVKRDIDSIKIRAYISFIKLCQERNISIVVVVSPYLAVGGKRDTSITIAKTLASYYNIPFLDFSNDHYFQENARLFADHVHLNDAGARVFSKMIAQVVTRLQQKKKINYSLSEVDLLIGDSTKAQTKLGWKPSTSLHQLVKEMMHQDLLHARSKQTATVDQYF